MICDKCGKQIPDGASVCENCGVKSEQTEGMSVGGSGDIRLCRDGKYRWYYEYPMLKNPVMLFTVWKVMLIAALLPAAVVFLSELSNGFLDALKQFLIVYGIAFGVIFVLSCIGYFILAASYGFRYIVLFEMDEDGVTHAQQDRQFKKAQAVSLLAVLAGAASGSPEVMGAGILAGSKQKMTSEFRNVSTVIGMKKKNTIKVNQLLAKNQVYVKEEDYDFVWEFITSRCKAAKIR